MKSNYLKSLLMMLGLVIGGGSLWAEEATLSISSGFTENGNLNDNKSNSWAITSDGSYTSNTSYIQVGTNKSSVTYLKLSTSAYSTQTISKIQVWATSKASTSVTTKVSIGGNQIGESSAYTTQNASSGGTEFSVNNTNGYKGEVLIEISRPSSAEGAIYFNKLIVTYEDASDTRTAVNMTAFSAAQTTIVKDNTTTTTVTNDQNGWTPSYTYTSSDQNVATVNANGVITAVAKGTATITASLDIANDDASWKKGTTTSMDVNITVVNPEHTAHFSVNGTVNAGDDCVAKEDDAITFPSNPADINGKVFVGWTKTSDYSNATTAPSDLVVSANMGNADVTYYAVFADVEVGEDTPSTFYYEPFTGSAHSTGFASDNVAATQSMFYDKSATVWSHYTDTKAPSTTSYATNLDGSDMSNGVKIYKQINNSTATILEVKGIDIRNAKNLNVSLYNRRSYTNATLTVEYKIDNAANYTSAGGTIVYNSTNDKWKFTDGLSISGTGSTLDLKISVAVTGSTNRIMLIDDVKVYGDLAGTTYSNYCTTVLPTTGTLNFVATTDNTHYYATFSSDRAIKFDEAFINDGESCAAAIKAYAVSVNGNELVLTDQYDVNNDGNYTYVPANTGILFKYTLEDGTFDGTVPFEYADDEAGSLSAVSGNLLVPATTPMTAADTKFYKLAKSSEGKLGFFYGATDGAAFTMTNANGAYLAVPNSLGSVKGFSFDAIETAIQAVEVENNSNVIYDLQGRRVSKAQKGLYIVNGKKVLF